MKDQELAIRARNGDAEAFARLYEEIYKDLYRFALYTLGNVQDAEDAVSEAVTDGFSQIRSLRKAEAFRSWMFRILSNKCRQKRKSYLNREWELPADLTADQRNTEEELDVRQAFFQLDDQERMILSLHLFAGYKTREIGSLLHMNHNTVRSRESRALKKLENMLTI